ncbi:protein grpE [Candidatus Nitromaritima sp. SCGC AAA799-A02]|nr:protein grpE [Candidatus Nitromaritima sp. SCGC AAA799-A02]KMP11895.1 protein grpE [Candidatus Nitromaritima sp. SCGC AAA799-C22]
MDSKKNTHPPEEPPKIQVNDRRHWVHEEDDASGDSVEEPNERFPTYVEQLKKEAEEKDKQLREYITAYKNKNAENDEFRVRLQKENETRLDQFKANLFARLLPTLDNLKRAAQSASQAKDLESLQKGIELVINQFARELRDNGVEEIPAAGEKFDPKSHEALMTIDTDDAEQDGKVVEELEPGYRFKEKLIKAAKVKIARLKAQGTP